LGARPRDRLFLGKLEMREFNLQERTLRELNELLQSQSLRFVEGEWKVLNPDGAHAIAVGLDSDLEVLIDGHVGYYCAGMNKLASVNIKGSAGPGVAENMMSGKVIVEGNVSQCAGATGHGGLLVIKGNASSRCGISMKGIDILVHGNIGHMSAFMAQAGNLIVLGDAGDSLGDSLYEAKIFIRGNVKSLGADCIEKEMRQEHIEYLEKFFLSENVKADPKEFRRFGSARKLYNFDIDNSAAY